jgi:hypothetical protein
VLQYVGILVGTRAPASPRVPPRQRSGSFGAEDLVAIRTRELGKGNCRRTGGGISSRPPIVGLPGVTPL